MPYFLMTDSDYYGYVIEISAKFNFDFSTIPVLENVSVSKLEDEEGFVRCELRVCSKPDSKGYYFADIMSHNEYDGQRVKIHHRLVGKILGSDDPLQGKPLPENYICIAYPFNPNIFLIKNILQFLEQRGIMRVLINLRNKFFLSLGG